MFLFNDTATPEIYTLSLHELFRSERVAVGRRILRLLGALGARGAADVRDHHRLSQLLLQQRRERPEDIVDRKSTRLNSSHTVISYAVFCLKKKKNSTMPTNNTIYT